MSRATDTRDAIVAELTSGTFSPAIAPIGVLVPQFDLEKVGAEPVVSVWVRGIATTPASRTTTFFDISVDIGVQIRIPSDDLQAEVGFDLAEAILDFMNRRPLASLPGAKFRSIENEPAASAEHAVQHRVFTSIITCIYRIEA